MEKKLNNKDYNNFISLINRKELIDTKKTYDYWGNIPIEVEYLEPLYEIFKSGMTFIDLGCGAGNVLRYAKNVGFKVKGVEFNLDFKPHLRAYDVEFMDVLDFSIDEIIKFDVIYSYKPLKFEFDKFIHDIKNALPKNSHLITPYFN